VSLSDFKRPLVGAGDHPAVAAVVEQHVHRLLQHALFVADDDIGRFQIHQPLEPVVAVDHPPVQIVQIRGGEPPAFQRHQGPQVRRQHRNDIHDHPDGIEPLNGGTHPRSFSRLESFWRLATELVARTSSRSSL
jgi:hypothetical protein